MSNELKLRNEIAMLRHQYNELKAARKIEVDGLMKQCERHWNKIQELENEI